MCDVILIMREIVSILMFFQENIYINQEINILCITLWLGDDC